MWTLWHLQCILILFCLSVPDIKGVKQTDLTSGFGTWDPGTAYITRCDFNNNSRPFCDWTQPCKVNQGAWIRTKHATPTSGTGPDGDYPDGNGYFIYQEASNLVPFDTDRIASPEIVVSGEICIDFWYHMFGSEELNELKVIIQNEGVEDLVWSQKGNQGSSWIYGFTTVNFLPERRIKVIFEAVRGLTEYGDTAVDNVGVRNGPCVMVPSTTPPASSTATPESALPVITEATCSVHSDPHYYTFDKQSHTFMGNCTYTLSKLCDGNSTLPYFNVEAANEHRGGNTRVSYVQYVDVDVYDYRITLGKNRVVKVNGAIQVLPVVLASGVNISFSGQYVMVTTAFGLRVKFNGDHRAEVILPSIYMSKVCGMCGNYNGHKADDFLNPDGEMEANSVSLGNSWQIYNDSSCVPDLGHTPNCSDDETQMIQSNKYCGLITDPSGPFWQCHSVADPLVYFEDCLYDLCELHLNNAALCNNLQSYADVCQAAGIPVGTWRNETFCPLICPANSHYEACTAACPATCVNPMAPASCSLPCVEGCVCDSGYLLYNDGCVPSSQCGCWHNGKHYPVGAEFWTDDTCSSKCTCPSRGSKVTCSNAACPADHYCGVQNGEPGCYRETYGICRVHNDPHYNTFDRETHHFMGKCTYTLAKVCANSSSLPYFNVEAKNEHRGYSAVSYVQKVLVEVYGQHIEIVKATPNRVLINKIWSTLPVTTAGGSITVSRSGRYVILETDFRLRVSYDTDHSVEVKVPTTYFNRTCGMCGNFNNRREDDYMMPDGQQAKNSNELGNSWRVKDDDPSCDVIVPPKPCPADQENLYRTDRFCGMITKRPGPFGVCHSVINPESIFESCVYDLCALNGNEQLLCNALATYADACQEAGVTLPQWRNATFCPLPCLSNSHYNPCTSACPATCSNPVAASNCSKPCVEGCECNSGFVLSGGQCVSMGNCGCLYKDKYYERGETFWETNCAGQCNCAGNNTIVCSPKTCEASKICKVQNGILGCYPLDINTCHIYGDPHYITFDGRLYHFQGGCNYTIVETCTNSSEQFSVTTRNEHRGSQAWTALNSVAVTLKNIHIALRKNKEVHVNGIQVDLPVTLHPGITVAVRGPYVVIDTSIGIQVKFDGDQQLFVHADESFKGQLCGLCGTYTDNQLDDFLRPDRVLEQDSNNFGNSWRVKDDNWICDPVPVIPPACNPVHEYEYEEFCKVILASGGPFEACHWYIPPQLYFESCVYDQCTTGGNIEQFCSSLDAYAAACEGRGISLGDWREETFCAATNSTVEPSTSFTTTDGTVPPAHCNMSCSFDTDFCDWTQSVSDSLDWKRHRGPTSSPNTGPSYDHTTGDGYFIYLQGSEASSGAVAHLESPVCSANGAHCFRFWYHMYGVAHAMALRVYVTEDGAPRLVWSETGNKGDRWNFAAVTVYNRGDMQIVLEGMRGEDFRSDVAVDDVSLVDGYCPGDGPTTTVSPTSVTTPSSTGTTTSPPLPSSESCVVSGDPHYYTFDKQTHHFMGTCAYTLSKLCDGNSTLPYFNVEAANEHRGGNARVSYVQYVDVDVYDVRITLEKGGVVKVNGKGEIVIPFAPSSGVQISSSGLYVVVSTDFGLTVKFDGNHRVEVTLLSSFKEKVCGMCGNYNGNAADDFLNPDGVLEADSTSLGNSWQVSNHTSCLPGTGHDPVCDESDKQIIASSAFCGLLTDVNGPFKKCHRVLDPTIYFSGCFYDQCELQMDPDSLCKSLQSYADACQSRGAEIDAWRNATFCPIDCPANSHYEACTAACPATCVNPMAPASCSLPCVEGCVCDSGYLLYNDGCVPSSQCGCWHNGKHYPVGAEFWTDDTCSSKCTCPSRGSKVTCSNAACPADHYCGVQNGEPGCYRETYGICRVHNDPHYNTFDRETHHFMGVCTYTLAKVCANSSSLPYFNVEAKNEHRGNPTVSYVQKVLVEVYGQHIEILRNHPSQVLVNEVLTTLPVRAAGGSITVSRSGRYVILETDFRLRVSYDTDHSVEVKVPTTYFNRTCGMCGNFNNRREDDYMMPDGQQAKNSNELGNSWRVKDDDPSCDVIVPPDDICPADQENLYRSDRFCGMITKRPGPFGVCHSVINPESIFESCVYDLCALNGSEALLCSALATYADACREAGVMLPPWRNATFCPPTCSAPNSHYEPCMTACPATCLDRLAPENCSKPCVEGCACNSGFVLSGGTCVPEAKCGCVFQDRYYSEGESVVTENCTSRCECLGNGNMTCSELSCGPDEICKIQTGLRGCYPAGTATCHIYGDPHYTTFDGKLHHFQGACNYTVVETCDNASGSFRVTTRNEHRGSPSWTAINSVALTLDGIHIALGKKGIVYINGALASLPETPLPGVTVSLIGRYVQVTTNVGVQLQFNGDHELFVRVTEKYKGRLCGLCGTYTGTQQDDFRRPDGVVVADVNEFGASWRVPDDEWPCNSTIVPPVTCTPSEQQAAEERCRILTDREGPFAPCHSAVPSALYFESCVYDQCATGGSSEQLCNDLESYAAACAAAGVALGEWAADTICAATNSTVEPSTSFTTTDVTGAPITSSPTTVGTSPSESTTVQETTPASETSSPHTISTTAEESTTGKSPTTASPTTVEPCQTGRATCSASGDPHYYTFDGRVHHFMGNCTYTLSKVCNDSRGLPPFDVSTTNEHRGSNTKVSYVKAVHVDVYGSQISLLKNRKVNVNGTRRNLPVVIENKIKVQISGGYVLLETDFGLWVRFDGNHYVEVSVSSCYKGQLCGLCGNYNGDAKDDNIKPNGSTAGDSTELGESWLVAENNTICSPDEVLVCDPLLESEARKNTACGIITDPTGIFKDCHATVAPENFLENCVYDMCQTEGQTVSLCNGLQAYAESCTNAGICREWRHNTLCPISCPGGSQYESCGSRCPSTCVTPSAFSPCSSLPVEGCFCKEGYVLSGDTCVPESNCGCVDGNSHYHQLGENWFTHDTCTERCTCNSKNNITCTGWECGALEKCSVQDGVLGCYSPGRASCQVAGDPHYFTFDKVMHTFLGTCTYTLLQVCNSNSVVPVTISGKNEDRGQRGATYLKEVYIDIYGNRITLQKNKAILLNKERVRTPVKNRLRGVSIGNVGIYMVVETDFGLLVKYDGNQHLEISLPESYFSKVCGMCGNYNGQRGDELLMPNGVQAKNITQFGNSWKVQADSDAGCLPDTRDELGPPCTAEEKPGIENQCNVLKSDTFKPCHHLIEPDLFIQTCIYDMCKYDGMLSTLCAITQAYVDTCKKQGVIIKWRTNTFCPLPCPSNSYYTDCASPCPATCNNIYASSLCEKPTECTEGCVCNEGYVLSDDQCVPLSECGCRDDEDNYYSAGESWIKPHCTHKCTCQKDNTIKCQAYGCDAWEVCFLNNKGKYKCKPTGFGKCLVIGDPHYLTFDGLMHHFQGKDTYVLSQTVSSIPDRLPSFSIEGKNKLFPRVAHISFLQEIRVSVYNHTVWFRQKKQLVVDGVKTMPPAQPHEGLRIYQRPTRIYMETDFGLSLSYDGAENLDITLANTYKSKVEGLCGNFDGKYKNDFTKPDGTRVRDVDVFGESWKVPVTRTVSRGRREVISDEELDNVELNTGVARGCNPSELSLVNSTSKCGILTDPKGPFGKCQSNVSIEFFQMGCVFDLCVEAENNDVLCRHLEQYALACQENGIALENWRAQTPCEMQCPTNSKYSSCMTACPDSCSNLAASSECESPCVEGCECLPGYVLSGYDCVPYKECGCSFLNTYYKAGEMFVTDDCSQTCECTTSSSIACTRAACTRSEICAIANFTRGCYIPGPCLQNICENGGTCIEDSNSSSNFSCVCPDGYEGPLCEAETPDEPPEPDNNLVYIIVGVLAGIIVLAVIVSLVVCRSKLRMNRKKSVEFPRRRNSSLTQSRDALDQNSHVPDYSVMINPAFDRDENQSRFH